MTRVVLAANNGDVGGGEVMLLATAGALTDLGAEVLVVGPDARGGVLDAAADRGLPVVRLAPARATYLRELRSWARRTEDWVWCHGLVPSAATAGRRRRIVHLHQEPVGAHRPLTVAARAGAAATLVPSHFLRSKVAGSEVLWNWTEPLPALTPRPPARPVHLGFIGRHSTDKGLDVLAQAVALLDRADPGGGDSCSRGTDGSCPTRRPVGSTGRWLPCGTSSTTSAGATGRTSRPPRTSPSSPPVGTSRSGSSSPSR